MRFQKVSAGFSLIEIIVSMGLLILIIGFLPMASLVQQSNQYSMNRTYATNIALNLSEELITLHFDDLGNLSFDDCVDEDGKTQQSSSNGVCAEDPMNITGYTESEAMGQEVYFFTRYSVVCTDTTDIAGGLEDSCDIPVDNLETGPVPDTLACNSADYTPQSKGIKILVTYRDKAGKCFTSSLEASKVSY